MATLKTRLHLYCFESGTNPAYKAMVREIEANGDGRGHWMNSWGGDAKGAAGRFYGDGMNAASVEEVEIDLSHVFGNQWNESGEGGRRLFDWYEEYEPRGWRSGVKRGHWLEVTPEMSEARRLTLKCRYCGHQYGPYHDPLPEPAPVPGEVMFCARCLDSEHLKPDDLKLLRLSSVAAQEADGKGSVAELSESERAWLMPRYVARQTTGSDSRAKRARDRQRERVLEKFDEETAAATAERDGMLWLWNRGLSLDNVIYYSHTGKFSFGWRSPVSAEVEAELLKVVSEFPFPYEIKTAGGKKLEAY